MMNLAGIFVRENGLFMKPENKARFYHDGRFTTLHDVVNHYDTLLHLALSDQEKNDLVEYLKSLPSQVRAPHHCSANSIRRATGYNACMAVKTLAEQRCVGQKGYVHFCAPERTGFCLARCKAASFDYGGDL
jgi:hypothetical protein